MAWRSGTVPIDGPQVDGGDAGAAPHVGGIEFTLDDPLYAPIRSDPRNQTIIERLKVR